jgi:hypothetical protein
MFDIRFSFGPRLPLLALITIALTACVALAASTDVLSLRKSTAASGDVDQRNPTTIARATVGQAVIARGSNGSTSVAHGFWPGATGGVVAVDGPSSVPAVTVLRGNSPNPFNPMTTIRFDLAETSPVSIRVFAVDGRRVDTIVDETRPAGRYEIRYHPDHLASGLYFYEFRANGVRDVRRFTLLK